MEFKPSKKGLLVANGCVEVFYSINRTYWNNGFGTEALQAMISLGFHQIGRDCATVQRHKRPRATVGIIMQRLSADFFCGPAFASDKDGGH